ncbi:putative amidohydrolase [Phyllobacterium myrsinacearum]|uniref:carbon-nitrogen hydrolase family protein n=1 Tax=Phyllobacterium myrsinacearum TaxID=28101 RepID=UPI001028D8C8|nr:carbon-nitrogen hydrolase family protein [Phyllobacterium myrsinacearum]RZS81959.1 putative amidohydrolase [Phyllobacterium myrsinacearum]
MSSFRAAAIQMRSGVDPQRNAADLAGYVAEAAGKGAVYVQTPEMTGALQRDRKALADVLRAEEDDIIVRTASEVAAEHGIHLHIGSTAIAREDGKIANRAFLFGPDGKIITRYDKIHMFDVDLDNGESWRESAVYAPGSDSVVAALPFARLGLAICYDVRFPQLFRAQALAGASVLTAPAAFTRQTGEAHWHILQRARAIENGAFVISAAQGGVHEDGRETFGHSIIVAPWGEILAEAGHADPAVIVADIDPSLSAAARSKVPNLKNARPFGLVIQSDDGQSERQSAAS